MRHREAIMRVRRFALIALFVLACGSSFVVGRTLQVPERGTMLTSPTRGGLQMLLDAPQIGGPQVSVGERSYPANYESAEHEHQSIEIIYVLSGEFQHVVNGRAHILKTGELGYVKPGDKVQHKTGAAPAKTLMIWVPGTDGTELARNWRP
jgi:quercetin dioxygenase-like cupin family protein